MPSEAIIISIITGLVSLLAGGGGVFAYLTHRDKLKHKEHESSITEWKALYDEMKLRLDEQESENKKLKDELFELKQDINGLTLELQNYKKYDTYIFELEKYIDHVLHTSQSLLTLEAYTNLKGKRPVKPINIDN